MKTNSKLSIFLARKDKSNLLKYSLIDILFHFKKRKNNFLLDHSNVSENFYKKYLKDFYTKEKSIKEIFSKHKFFAYTNISEEKEVIINLINREFPNFEKKVLIEAKKILNNQFKIFEKEYQFENGILWNFSFFNGVFWPSLHASKINIHNLKDTADLKYNWEFNKHPFLVTLGLAYYFTGEEKYCKKIIELILDWVRKNPPRYNLCWLNALEISMMLISWLFSLFFIKDSSLLTQTIFYRIFKSMFQQAYFINVNIERFSYNHTIGEFFAIFMFSSIFYDIPIIKRWFKNSSKKLRKQIKRQILNDGVNIERSLNYHRFTLEIFSLFLIICSKQVTKYEKSLINKMYTFFKYSIKPDKSLPLIGDSDDANVIPLIFYDNDQNLNNYIELLTLGTVLFDRGDLKNLIRNFSPLSLLLLGKKGYDQFKNIRETKSPKTYKFFPKAGYFIAKNNFSSNSNYLLFDMAPFSPYGGHDHLDISNLIYSYKGTPILVDSGTYRYNIDLKIRNAFKDINAHNVLTINRDKKVNSTRTFIWTSYPKITINEAQTNTNFIFEVEHNIFKDFKISRKISTSRELNNILIKDIIKPNKKNYQILKIYVNFHFFHETKINVKNYEIIINDNLRLLPKLNPNFKFKIIKRSYYYSPFYGVKFLAPMISLEFTINNMNMKPICIEVSIEPLNKVM